MKIVANNFVHPLGSQTDIRTILDSLKNYSDDNEPFFVCNVADIITKYKLWKLMFPRVKPFYGVNNNSSSVVLETLAELGAGFECTTKNDIIQASSVASADSIFLSGGCSTNSLIKCAAKSSVHLISFDNYKDLVKIKDLYPKANLLIHIRAQHAEEMLFNFGCDPDDEFDHLLSMARTFNLHVVGIHLNVTPGSENRAYSNAISLASTLFDKATTFGYEFNLLSLGRGFPPDSLNEVAQEVNIALERHFPNETIDVVANPAQFFVESAYTLSCKIQFIRDADKIDSKTGDARKHFQYFINDGVFGSFNNVLCGKQNFTPQPATGYPISKSYSSSIWGPTGNILDLIIEEVSLPEMKIGDSIIFDNMGIFTASSYNGFPIHKVYIIANDEIWLHIQKDCLPLKELYFIMGNITEELNVKRKKKYSSKYLDQGMPIDIIHIMEHGLCDGL